MFKIWNADRNKETVIEINWIFGIHIEDKLKPVKFEFLNFTVFIVDVDLSQMAKNQNNKGSLLSQTVKVREKK